MVIIFESVFYPFIYIFIAIYNLKLCSSMKETSSYFENVEEIDTEDLLLLTPYLVKGEILEAQKLAKVSPSIGGLQSYSGYFTVDEECGNHLYFWFIPAEYNWEIAPVILWLNGGPGASSLFGLFEEVGPWNYVDGKLVKSKFSWTKSNNVIFIDQPVGTGFSFSQDGCYAETLSDIAKELYSGLVQFFTMFPKLQKNKFFMVGMSFAGHYIPVTAVMIDNKNLAANVKINLIGIVVGSPSIDYTCHYKGDLLFELGIVDEQGKNELKALDQKLLEYIKLKDFQGAAFVDFNINKKLFDFGVPNYSQILDDKPAHTYEYSKFITAEKTRKQLHVSQIPYLVRNKRVFGLLEDAYYTSVTTSLEYLLKKKYTVGFFNGQLDIICAEVYLSCVLKNLNWDGVTKYAEAVQKPWFVSNKLVGWFKVVDNFFTVVVRNSGHNVSQDQGEAILTLISTVVAESPGTQILSKLKTSK